MYNDLQTLFKHSSLFETFGDYLTDEHRSSICKVLDRSWSSKSLKVSSCWLIMYHDLQTLFKHSSLFQIFGSDWWAPLIDLQSFSSTCRFFYRSFKLKILKVSSSLLILFHDLQNLARHSSLTILVSWWASIVDLPKSSQLLEFLNFGKFLVADCSLLPVTQTHFVGDSDTVCRWLRPLCQSPFCRWLRPFLSVTQTPLVVTSDSCQDCEWIDTGLVSWPNDICCGQALLCLWCWAGIGKHVRDIWVA